MSEEGLMAQKDAPNAKSIMPRELKRKETYMSRDHAEQNEVVLIIYNGEPFIVVVVHQNI